MGRSGLIVRFGAFGFGMTVFVDAWIWFLWFWRGMWVSGLCCVVLHFVCAFRFGVVTAMTM